METNEDFFCTETMDYTEDEINDIIQVLKQLSLNTTRESGIAMLKLIDFISEMNNVEKPILDLKHINSFMQNNFFHKIPILGIIVPITDPIKIDYMQKCKELDNWFEDIGLYSSPEIKENDITDIINSLKENSKNKVVLRIMGNNELILEQQFRRAREILQYIPEEYRNQVDIKLLGKTNINMFFGEDKESEILIMKRMARNWLGDLGCPIYSVPKIGNANTIDTVKKEQNSRARTNNGGEVLILDILCPNGAERQEEDIKLDELKIKKRIIEIENELNSSRNIYKKRKLQNEKQSLTNKLPTKHYYDGCGGVNKLRENLNNSLYGYGCDKHQLADQYWNQKQNSNFDRWKIKNKFNRFSDLIKKLNRIYYPNILCELAKNVYTKIQAKEISEQTDMLETNLAIDPLLNENDIYISNP